MKPEKVLVIEDDARRTIAKVPASRVEAIRGDVVAAAIASGHRRTAVHAGRTKPIDLTEEAGVRIALAILATAPVRKSERIDAIRRGLDAMTSEEVFYWYAHVTGQNSASALKALRVLLAGE